MALGHVVQLFDDRSCMGMRCQEFRGNLRVVQISKLPLQIAETFQPRGGTGGVENFNGVAEAFGGDAEGVGLIEIGIEERFDGRKQGMGTSLLRRRLRGMAELAFEEFSKLGGGQIALTAQVLDGGIAGGQTVAAQEAEGDIAIADGGGAVADAADSLPGAPAAIINAQGLGEPAHGHAEIVDGIGGDVFRGSLHLCPESFD